MTGEQIRAWRQAQGLTMEELAHELGCTWSTVQRWETGKSAPSRLPGRRLAALMAEKAKT